MSNSKNTIFLFYGFSLTKSENSRVEQVLLWELVVGTSVGGGGERNKKMDLVQITYSYVFKCKIDTCLNYSRNGQGVKESSVGSEFQYDIFDTL
jgi:hypothetical protein